MLFFLYYYVAGRTQITCRRRVSTTCLCSKELLVLPLTVIMRPSVWEAMLWIQPVCLSVHPALLSTLGREWLKCLLYAVGKNDLQFGFFAKKLRFLVQFRFYKINLGLGFFGSFFARVV